MANDAENLVVAGTGRVLVAAVGTTAPTTLSGAYAAGWSELGYTTEDGVAFSDSKSSEDIRSWQSFNPTRTIITARDTQVTFSLQEWNLTTVPFAFGGGAVTEPSAGIFLFTPADAGDVDERALSVEWTDGSEIFRLIIPRGVVTDATEVNLTKTEVARLPVTYKVLGTDGSAPWTLLSNSSAFDASP